MRIAIIGIRGIPVTYSAFETFAQVLSTEFIKKDHQVIVYCRNGLVARNKKTFQGVGLISLPHSNSKNFSTFTHSFLATMHAMFREKFDVIIYLGVGSTFFSVLPRIIGIKTLVHIDGQDWKRKKWGIIGRNYLKINEFLTVYFPNKVITDSKYMVNYYQNRYKKAIDYIPYGYFESRSYVDRTLLKRFRVEKRKYFVWVGRFVPENHIEDFLSAFSQLNNNDIKCLILGDDIYESSYKKSVYDLLSKDKRIIFRGFIKHEEVLSLEQNSLAYIETKRSGGTHMSLVEAMGAGALIISNENEANKDVLGDTALYYDASFKKNSLEVLLSRLIENSNHFNTKRIEVKKRAKKYYSWATVIAAYEKLFLSVIE